MKKTSPVFYIYILCSVCIPQFCRLALFYFQFFQFLASGQNYRTPASDYYKRKIGMTGNVSSVVKSVLSGRGVMTKR